jgi:glutamate-1-semialdehyde 2,1-aminomutase
MEHTKSIALTPRFNELFPGSHTNFKVPLEPTPYRLFCSKSEGCRVWDVDGNEYVEFNGAMGPTMIGHRHPHLVEAMHKYIDTMNPQLGTGVCVTEYDIALAEKFVKHVPCAEAMHLNLSGTDAVQLVIRLARAYTGKPLFVRFGGSYHGWSDNVLGGRLQTDPNKKPFAFFEDGQTIADDITYSEGIGRNAFQESLLIPTNDFEALEATFAKYGDEIALVHMEPIMNNHWGFRQKPGFIEKVRELCDKHGALMSFDEVICGFRHGIGGAQEYLGITPDLASFGKAMAGGYPVSAVAGKKEIINLIGDFRVLAPGTANGWPMGNAAALLQLRSSKRITSQPISTSQRFRRC